MIDREMVIKQYEVLKSSNKVAIAMNISKESSYRILKEAGVLRTKSQASKEKDISHLAKGRTIEWKNKLSSIASQRTGEKNPFYGKTHTIEVRENLSVKAKERTGKRNPNYKDGKYIRRPRDFKIAEFTKIRNFVFNRDKYTCFYTKKIGNHLHAHHVIPYWVCPEAFLDPENLITVSTEAHFKLAHSGNWACFDVSLISDSLIQKYNLDRERLNELATLAKGRCESLNCGYK